MIHIKPVLDMLKVHSTHYKSVGDYSVTTLLNPPRYVHLYKRYVDKADLNYDVMMPSFIGTGVHAYVEQCLSKTGKYTTEQRMIADIADRRISGTFDIYGDGEIWDIKTCKTWKVIFDPEFEEWTQQQNIYAFLLHLKGIEVKRLNIIALFLDWIELKSVKDPNYPQSPVVQYQLPLWSWKKTEEFLVGRVELMKKYEETPDNELPACTSKEMWEDPTHFACFKTPKAKRAARVFDTIDEAIGYMKSTGGYTKDSFIEIRHGRRKRCDRYCEVNIFCNHYQAYKKSMDDSNLIEIIPYEQI